MEESQEEISRFADSSVELPRIVNDLAKLESSRPSRTVNSERMSETDQSLAQKIMYQFDRVLKSPAYMVHITYLDPQQPLDRAVQHFNCRKSMREEWVEKAQTSFKEFHDLQKPQYVGVPKIDNEAIAAVEKIIAEDKDQK